MIKLGEEDFQDKDKVLREVEDYLVKNNIEVLTPPVSMELEDVRKKREQKSGCKKRWSICFRYKNAGGFSPDIFFMEVHVPSGEIEILPHW